MILRIHRALCTIPACAVCLLLDDLERQQAEWQEIVGWSKKLNRPITDDWTTAGTVIELHVGGDSHG